MSAGSITTSALLACAAAACAWKSAPRLGHGGLNTHRFWNLQAALLFGLGLAYALALDTCVLQWGRQAALQSGLYAWRRPFQAALLLAGLLLAFKVLRCPPAGRADGASAPLRKLCACASALVLVVFGARTVSLHGVDAVLAYRVLDLGLGRWLEWGAAVVVCAAAVCNGFQAPARKPTLKAWEPPRV